ncbi:MAG: methyltransferase [Deltaproteobacteria bacterium]|nr:methyltransferase [Deltaproteobacteria bacterium]
MEKNETYSTDELSSDTLFNGRVLLFQPKKGYRFSVDSPLLTWFCWSDRPADHCADLGSGCGVIGISLLVAQQAKHVVAVEIQSKLASLSLQNAEANSVTNNFTLIKGDMRENHRKLPQKTFDLVVSNPPFWPSDSGRLPPDEERRIARHEISITLFELIQKAETLLHPRRGRFCIAFPAMRVSMLLSCLAQSKLNASKIIFIHPNQNSNAELVLLEARIGRAGQLKIAPPLYLRDTDNQNSEIASEILSGAFCPSLHTLEDLRSATR